MPDQFSNSADHVSAPATRAIGVTPHDSNVFADISKALYVGTGGTIVVAPASGADATFVGVAGGSVLPVRARAVRATGTTAADIVALY